MQEVMLSFIATVDDYVQSVCPIMQILCPMNVKCGELNSFCVKKS